MYSKELEKIAEQIKESAIKKGPTDFGKKIWPIIKKTWPKEAKQLEKEYNQELNQELKKAVADTILFYGFSLHD